jgi:hypothetical protein
MKWMNSAPRVIFAIFAANKLQKNYKNNISGDRA